MYCFNLSVASGTFSGCNAKVLLLLVVVDSELVDDIPFLLALTDHNSIPYAIGRQWVYLAKDRYELFGNLYKKFGFPKGDDCGEFNTKGYTNKSEVIGNIYENPMKYKKTD